MRDRTTMGVAGIFLGGGGEALFQKILKKFPKIFKKFSKNIQKIFKNFLKNIAKKPLF